MGDFRVKAKCSHTLESAFNGSFAPEDAPCPDCERERRALNAEKLEEMRLSSIRSKASKEAFVCVDPEILLELINGYEG